MRLSVVRAASVYRITPGRNVELVGVDAHRYPAVCGIEQRGRPVRGGTAKAMELAFWGMESLPLELFKSDAREVVGDVVDASLRNGVPQVAYPGEDLLAMALKRGGVGTHYGAGVDVG